MFVSWVVTLGRWINCGGSIEAATLTGKNTVAVASADVASPGRVTALISSAGVMVFGALNTWAALSTFLLTIGGL